MSYPVLLRLEGQRCVIVGGGTVAARKAADLLNAGAQVTVISPVLSAALENLSGSGRIDVRLAAFQPGILGPLRPFLIFAATDSQAVNRQVVDEARSLGALVDSVDAGGDGNFSSMATIRHGRLIVAISTGGSSPALAAHLRTSLAKVFGPEYGTLADWLAEFRPVIRGQIASEQDRRAVWQAIIESAALDLLRQGDQPAARRIVDDLLDEAIAQAKPKPSTDSQVR